MTESDNERDKRLLRELEGKNIAFYSTMLSAWISTKMERDKTLVSLSAAGIGLLVTILTAVGIESKWLLVLFVVAFSGFGFCIWTSLKIYQLNSVRIENELKNKREELHLEEFDKKSLRAFIIGVIGMCLIGLSSAYINFEENKMKNENRSLEGISNLKPTQPNSNPKPKSKPQTDTSKKKNS